MGIPATPASRPRPFWPALGLMLAIVVAYANTLHAPFVYDDTAAIVDNPTIRQLGRPGEILGPQKEGGLTVSGRPVLNLSFALSYAVSGAAPWGHHVFNILVHAGCALLLFGIVRRTLLRRGPGGQPVARGSRSRGTPAPGKTPAGFPGQPLASPATLGGSAALAFAVAAWWALHPLQTQAVTYTVQRAESLMGVFYLLTLYAFVRATEPLAGVADPGRPGSIRPASGRAWLAASVVACAFGMATKEVMATAPLVMLLYDRTFVAGTFTGAWRARRGYYCGLAATWLGLAALLASTGGNRGGTAGLGVGVPWWAYGLTQFQAVTRYLALSGWPHPLVFEYGTFWVKHPAEVLPEALLVAGLLAATGWALRRRPVAGFLGASFFLILAPTSLTPGTMQMIVEHRMYLPLACVLAPLAVGAWHVAGRRAAFGLAAVAVALALTTFDRNRDYRSHLALWSDTVAKRPENPRAHSGLAEAFAERGDFEPAIVSRREAVRLRPDESHYHVNLGLALAQAGRGEEAVRSYRMALRLVPTEARTHNNLAVALVQLGDVPAALPHYAESIRLEPRDPQYRYNRALAWLRLGRMEEAAQAFRETIGVQPDHVDAHFKLGLLLLQLQQPDAARTHLAQAVALRPEDGAAQFQLGNVLIDAERAAEAIPHYEAAVRLRPSDAEAHHNLGVAYARLERWREAQQEFETALRLKPDYPDAKRNLEQLRAVLGK